MLPSRRFEKRLVDGLNSSADHPMDARVAQLHLMADASPIPAWPSASWTHLLELAETRLCSGRPSRLVAGAPTFLSLGRIPTRLFFPPPAPLEMLHLRARWSRPSSFGQAWAWEGR